MNTRHLGAGFVALVLVACRGGVPRKTAAQTTDDRKLIVTLKELLHDDVYPHVEDSEHDGAAPKADVASTMSLSFATPRSDTAAPEPDQIWASLNRAVEAVGEQAQTYRQLAQRAAAISDPNDRNAVESLQTDIRAARDEQQAFYNGLLQGGLLSVEEFNETIVRIGLEDLDPAEVFADVFRAKIAELEARGRAMANDDHVVTVRAVLEPRFGTTQFLQVPSYYEKSDDELEDDLKRARTAEFERLRVEFEASRKLAAAIEELRAQHGSVRAALRASWGQIRADFDAWRRELALAIDQLEKRLRHALEHEPDLDQLSDAERAAWQDITALAADLARWREIARRFEELRDDPSLVAIDALFRDVRALVERIGVDESTSWQQRLQRLSTNLPLVIRDAADALVRESFVLLSEVLVEQGDSLREQLTLGLPHTMAALEALGALGVFERAVDIVDDGVEIPQPIDDLPKARLDLRKNPVGDGDTLRLEVKIWDRATYESKDARRTPLETHTFTSELIRTGWRWSGDVIFTRALEGANDDQFVANAAVSREYHWFSRDRPDNWFNRLDPGIGFHAAQLNMDPNTTTEIGVGLNASLWSGLVRAGIGYDLSIDADQEYWYFGFGLIGALERLDELRSATFGDGD